ncbi:hypothetical protein DSM106972_038520 [Dulcicalothrix desertica PCC 7102]|uniref:Uncharacterized protein n=2 Tax=Dulcicalothrix desertica TaxID=32056 RepID=A0A3S1ANB6_9CYAN|nr:hypothetical protein DSM106972_038520 [Dulcicalothrix desertica PCC 7102]
MLLSLVALVGTTTAGVYLFKNFGLTKSDGGVLRPLPQRIALGTAISSLGIAFAGGMWLYGKLYVASIDFDERAEKVYLNTVEFFGTKQRVIKFSDILGGNEHEGKFDLTDFNPSSISVNAPWKSVHLKGWKFPLIIDIQGEILNKELFEKL